MESENSVERLGRNIFFLYPSNVIQTEIIDKLAQQEFEVYSIRNHKHFINVLEKFPYSIILADIDEPLPGGQWENFIRDILAGPVTKTLDIGILSTSNNVELRKKYLYTLKVSCGFIVIHSDLKQTLAQVIDILKAADAKGKRRYVRARPDSETMASLNIPCNGRFIYGTIKDLSIVGFSCTFDVDPLFEPDAHIDNIQMKLHGILLKADGILFGSRMESNVKIYVILFTNRTSPSELIKVRRYIQVSLQAAMDKLLK
ncbi:MAG: pilus assembly protein PilZ [Treponema sp.]|jgi:hypothetical protein|nr:pilus assembly protein PilZ [Treponema sp.]